MKRLLKVVILVIVAAVAVVVTVFAVTFLGRRAIVDGEIRNGMIVVADGFSSASIIPLDDGRVALIDAGEDEGAAAIRGELGRRQLAPEAVSTILLTHGHPDHIGGVGQFPKAEVLALAAEIPLIQGRVRARAAR